MESFLQPVVRNLTFIPMAIMVYLPMKNQIKGSTKSLVIKISVVTLIAIIFSSLLAFTINIDDNIANLITLSATFYFYYLSIKTSLAKKIFTYLTALALLTYSAAISYVIDAIIHPTGNFNNFSIEGSFIELGIFVVLIAILFPLIFKYYVWLTDNYNDNKVWLFVSIIPIILIAINITMRPHYYENLFIGRNQEVCISIFTISFIIGIFCYSLFYRIARSAYDYAELQKRNQLLSIQSTQYESLIKHVDEMRAIRHDFRHQMRTVYGLAQEESCPKVKKFLSKYIDNASTSIKKYCDNTSVNSIISYYSDMANSNNIKLEHKILLNKNFGIDEADFCAMLGNLFENAIHACLEILPDKRYISIAIANTNANTIALSVKNSYSGNQKKENDIFLSTKHSGKGIGIASVRATVNKYKGVVKINHTQNEFIVEILMFTA